MKKGRLEDYYTDADKTELSLLWSPLIRAMGDDVKELEVTSGEFLRAMRSAITANVYHHVFAPDGTDYPTILAMKITII